MFENDARYALIRAFGELRNCEMALLETRPFPDRNKPEGKEDIEGTMYVFTDSDNNKFFVALWNGLWMAPRNGLLSTWEWV
jgi:hypothetical protein